MPLILATQEVEIGKIVVPSQPGQIVLKTLSQKTHHKKRVGGVAQVEGPEFKPQYWRKTKAIQLLSFAFRSELFVWYFQKLEIRITQCHLYIYHHLANINSDFILIICQNADTNNIFMY
jgi:hypothetical protein